MKKNKLLKLTVGLLISISILITAALLWFLFLLHHHRDDSKIINLAGKQRMISQRITKNCLLLTYSSDSLKNIDYMKSLATSLEELKENNFYLLNLDNSEQVAILLKAAQPHFLKIVENASNFSRHETGNKVNYIENFLPNETSFLQIMDNIVEQYSNESVNEIDQFKFFIVFSNVVIVLILFSLVAFIINPVIIENEKTYEIIQQKNVELSDINATKNKLFSIIAHDLRNPFHCILGLSEHLVTNIKDQKIEDIEIILNKIRIQSESTYQLLENLLDWAKTQTGQISFCPERIDLSKVINETVLFLKPLSDNKNITFIVTAKDGLSVFVDRDMLKTILRNLITNAIKYSKLNSEINILSEQKQDYTEIIIADKGIGISKDELSNLFQNKIQCSKQGTSMEKGTGLGLILCHEFVKRHNGNIRVESELNKGSKFILSIPVWQSDK